MTEQLTFTPTVKEFTGDEDVELYDVAYLKPNKELLRGKINPKTMKSIKANGQKIPILLCYLLNGDVVIVDGEQRLKIARKLGKQYVPAVFHPERLSEFEVTLLRVQLNNARQPNVVSEIMGVRELLDQFPNMSTKGLADTLAMDQGTVKSLRKQASLPRVLTDGMSDGSVSPDTIKALATKPRSVITKAESKYRGEREKWSVEVDDDTGVRQWTRLADQQEFKKPPSLLTAGDVKDFQRVSVAQNVGSLSLNLSVQVDDVVEGFAAVKDGKFITDLLPTSDDVRLSVGRKKATIVKVRGI